MKISLINYSYKLQKTTSGIYYITREFTKRGFKKWEAGKIPLKGGVIKIFN